MATIQNPQDEQNPNQPNQPITGGTSAVGTGGAGAKAPVSPVQQNTAPTQGYTDVASYLNANQQGGTQLGQSVAQNLTNTYTTAKQGIDTSANQANQAVQAGYTPENTQLIQQVASNPTAAASNQSQLGAFQKQLNDQYTGPSSYADLGNQQGNVANAQQYGNLLNTPGGNNVLIQQVENQTNPGQTGQGINALDTLLFAGNPGAVGQAQTAAAPINTLQDYLNQQANTVNTGITTGQQTAAQTAQDALNAFTGQTGTLTNLNQSITGTTAQDLAAAKAQQSQLQTDLSNLVTPGSIANTALNIQNYNVGQLSPQDIQALGITQDQANQLQTALGQAGTSQYMTAPNFGASSTTENLPLMQYLSQQDPNALINAGTAATPEQYKEMAAINQLLGSKTPQGEAINPLNANLAGTYNPANLNTFNYKQALQDAQNFAAQSRAAAQAQASGLSAQALAQHNAGKGGFLKGIMNNPIAQYLANPLTQVPTELKKVGVK